MLPPLTGRESTVTAPLTWAFDSEKPSHEPHSPSIAATATAASAIRARRRLRPFEAVPVAERPASTAAANSGISTAGVQAASPSRQTGVSGARFPSASRRPIAWRSTGPDFRASTL